MDVLKQLFERHFGLPVERVQPLQGGLGGSGRNIFRVAGGGRSAVGILYDVREENVAFLEFSRHFRGHGLPVPEIYGVDLDRGAYLEEDLGDVTLFQFLSENRSGCDVAPEVVEAYRKAAAQLPRFQVEAARDLNYKVCYPLSSFDGRSIAWVRRGQTERFSFTSRCLPTARDAGGPENVPVFLPCFRRSTTWHTSRPAQIPCAQGVTCRFAAVA